MRPLRKCHQPCMGFGGTRQMALSASCSWLKTPRVPKTSVPTPSSFIAKYTVALLRERVNGLLHLVPLGTATRYEFAREVIRAMGSKSQVQPARTAEFPAPARRPTYSALDNRKAATLLGAPLPDWQFLLHAVISEWTRA